MVGVKGARSGYLRGWTGKAKLDSYQDVGFGVFFNSLIHMVMAVNTQCKVFKGRKYKKGIVSPSSL